MLIAVFPQGGHDLGSVAGAHVGAVVGRDAGPDQAVVQVADLDAWAAAEELAQALLALVLPEGGSTVTPPSASESWWGNLPVPAVDGRV